MTDVFGFVSSFVVNMTSWMEFDCFDLRFSDFFDLRFSGCSKASVALNDRLRLRLELLTDNNKHQ